MQGFDKEVEMRKSDHQLQQGLYITHWTKATPEMPYSSENSGYAFQPLTYYSLEEACTPTTCEMKRSG